MRRFLSLFVALTLLASATASFADAEKKGKRKRSRKSHAHKADAAAASNGGPFSDVPRGHWAYEAVQKAAEAGILQGWNGRFHGNKVVNRYQMAVVVARMLDRVGVLKANGKVITGQDIANLESLVIEFADELALLNVKVSTLEDTVAGLKRDVDLIKADMRGVGARAGITGTAQARWVSTGDIGNGYRFANVNSSPASVVAGAPIAAATTGLTRYRGQQTAGTGANAIPTSSLTGPAIYDGRDFFTVSNFSFNLDREFDPHTHFHAQIEINAEGSSDSHIVGAAVAAPLASAGLIGGAPLDVTATPGAPASGRGNAFSFGSGDIFINEAYVTFADWFTDGVAGRLGVFALPMNTEVNGPSRTYQWTITPSVINSKWESLRPIGLDLFQHNERDSLMFYVGFFSPSDLQAGEFRSGALLSQNTGFGPFAQNDGGVNFAGRVVGLPGGTTAPAILGANVGRFPTPFSGPAMTDQPRGVRGQSSAGLGEGLSDDDIGYYAMIGSHPTNRGHRGFSWHVAYYDRNGDLRPGVDEDVSRTDWHAWQIAANYQWSHFLLAAQYFDGTSRNYTPQEIGLNNPTQDVRRVNTTPFANAGALDTESQGFFALLNWQFTRRGSATVRYEHASDETGAAFIKANIWTLGFNWRTSDHGWLQIEWISPDTYSQSENGVRNDVDIDDDLLQINYKYNW